MKKVLALLLLLATPASAQVVGSFPNQLTNGTTADASQVMANFNLLKNAVNANAAHNGVNSDITQLTGLTSLNSTTITNAGTLTTVGLTATGATSLAGLTASGASTFSSTLAVNGAFSTTSTATLASATVTGALSAGPMTGTSGLTLTGGMLTGGASFVAPYNGTGSIVVPVGTAIRATNVLSARAQVGAGGTLLEGFNVASSTNSSAGNYNITFTNSIGSYEAVVSPVNTGASQLSCSINSKSATGFNVTCQTGTTFTNTAFDVIVTGSN